MHKAYILEVCALVFSLLESSWTVLVRSCCGLSAIPFVSQGFGQRNLQRCVVEGCSYLLQAMMVCMEVFLH